MISINWSTGVISVPQSYLTPLGGGIYELDADVFRLDLKDLEDSEEGMLFPATHNHNTTVTLAGVTYARVIEIINGYTIEFEDLQYAVKVVGANTNFMDVMVVNQVSLRTANSAGLIVAGSGVIPADIVAIATAVSNSLRESIFLDTVNGDDITGDGSMLNPVQTIAVALALTISTGIKSISISGSISLGSNYDGYTFVGTKIKDLSSINLNSYDVDKCKFVNISISGTGTGNITAEKCIINSTNGVSGIFDECGILGITIPNTSNNTLLNNCYSSSTSTEAPIFNFNSSANSNVQIRNYNGGLTIRNVSVSTQYMSIDMSSGYLILENTCTDGDIIIRGVAYITNNSAGSTVVDSGLVDGNTIEQTKSLVIAGL